MILYELLQKVLNNTAVKEKFNIAVTHNTIGDHVLYTDPFSTAPPIAVAIGDDCAALPDGHGGYLLFSAEGIITPFLESSPWFAGYSAVMVNISDICSMGGLPLAVTDVIWLQDAHDGAEIWAGMKAASEKYGVPIVGGHTCYRSGQRHLAVSILGKANNLLTSYDAKPGDQILLAADLNGKYFENYPFFDASTDATADHVRKCIRLLSTIADSGLAASAKDISMGGVIGTLAMLLHTSRVGARVALEEIPVPAGVTLDKWLVSFPSYGYLLTADAANASQIKSLFSDAGITCTVIGEVLKKKEIQITYQGDNFTISLMNDAKVPAPL